MVSLNLEWIRSQFPALASEKNGQPIIFFDGPGGTQVPRTVVEAMGNYLLESNANAHGAFATSSRTDALIASARASMADLLGCDRDEIVFGANMTTLTYAFSRAIGRELQAGDEIVVTRLDHDANVSPWQALTEKGIIVRTVDINTEDCTLNTTDLEQKISSRTKIVAIGYACNAIGTVNDISQVVQLAHNVGALVFVDAVHYLPHSSINVRTLDCDFLVCSAYKFFGPHVGIIYGKKEHLTRLSPYKVRPASDEVPSRWETGTLNFEGLAGLVATIDYLTNLGRYVAPNSLSRRDALIAAMNAIQAYERQLCNHLISGLKQISGLKIYGIIESDRFAWRTPTVGVRLAGYTPSELAKALGDRHIYTWHGNVYALGLTERLGIESSGGFLRIGLVHYNTISESDRLLEVLEKVTSSRISLTSEPLKA
ncbi:cysteine desulfurase-like protein [Pleurocapsa sp. PCC 7319]|uniref:cysteine desulfurase-like protein n=1 Tax=Pleurocapsa sp. PCC 7319 TaxID=118161 RepID=UPI00034AB3A9|nr:cysteine desulfurase-like protein [Pleurocapsa sp. PCC 7319]